MIHNLLNLISFLKNKELLQNWMALYIHKIPLLVFLFHPLFFEHQVPKQILELASNTFILSFFIQGSIFFLNSSFFNYGKYSLVILPWLYWNQFPKCVWVKAHFSDPLWGVTLYYFLGMCMFECIPLQIFERFSQ
jgi:hypothetical protein